MKTPQQLCFTAILTTTLLLAGCGQTGPLYLPGHPPPGYDSSHNHTGAQPNATTTQQQDLTNRNRGTT